jgi:threonine aldolase
MIDLRSDTVTRPTPEMLQAMFSAKVGDDVFKDDPTVNALEAKVAALFGTEAAIYCPSGTMTNQIAIKVHTRPGDEVICHKHSHVYYYEGGGIAFNSSSSVCLLEGDHGRITAEDVEAHCNPVNDFHRPFTRLVSVENTMNKGGGAIYDFAELEKIGAVCKLHGLSYHLDGARLFNALAETNQSPKQYGALFDSISICLSKGLGAPVGSLLLGSNTFIKQAIRVRKALGGAMRQSGFMAAAGIYALDNHVVRLKEDHQRARLIGKELEKLSYIEEVYPVDSNILIFKLNDKMKDTLFINKLMEKDIYAVIFSPQTIRFVTHLDFTDEMMNQVIQTLKSFE